MPTITAETPRKDITIAGSKFAIPEPYAEGHVLNANEANALNQTWAENIRNNMAEQVKVWLNGKDADGDKPAIEAIGFDAAQEKIDEYVKTYAFGERRGGARMDPIEREARNLVEAKAKEAIKAQGKSQKDFTDEAWDAYMEKAWEANREKAMAKAKQIIDARAAALADF